MTNQEVFDIIACFDRSSSQTMKLTMKDFSIELSKCKPEAPAAPAMPAVPMPPMAPIAPAAPMAAAAPVQSEAPVAAPAAPAGEFITAPMVGTYYEASAPGETPYVAIGDRVAKGQTVCLMEAMKMISEVTAPCNCIIREILKTNGEMAEFGEPLFRYEPC